MLDLGYRGAETEKTSLEMMSASMRGGLAREGKYLRAMTKKLPGEKLQTLLRELRSSLDELPDHLDDVRAARQRVATTAGLLEGGGEGTSDLSPITGEFGDWLMGYSSSTSRTFVYGRSGMPGHWQPSKMLNPAPCAIIVLALLQTQTFLPLSGDDSDDSAAQQLPTGNSLMRAPYSADTSRRGA
ncbi:hypothetical protein BJV78DRAFT_1281382 [Lactifluus subvellereus]|nr:hypothetical protein BJV78DRAFT_1281382 [Lactifluus subvellereus]